jgi:hypothetical protein
MDRRGLPTMLTLKTPSSSHGSAPDPVDSSIHSTTESSDVHKQSTSPFAEGHRDSTGARMSNAWFPRSHSFVA